VELAPALVEHRPELVDPVVRTQVELQDGGMPAGGADLVVDLLQRPRAPRRDHHVRPLAGEREGKGPAEPARGAGDEGNAILETGAGGHGGLCWLCGGG